MLPRKSAKGFSAEHSASTSFVRRPLTFYKTMIYLSQVKGQSGGDTDSQAGRKRPGVGDQSLPKYCQGQGTEGPSIGHSAQSNVLRTILLLYQFTILRSIVKLPSSLDSAMCLSRAQCPVFGHALIECQVKAKVPNVLFLDK
jgi:hypothetical protein